MLILLIAFPDGEGKDTGPLHNIPCMVPRPEGLVLDLYVKSGSCLLHTHMQARSYFYEFGEEIAAEQV